MTAVQDLLLSTFVIVVIVNILLGQEKRNRTEKGRDGKVYLLLFAIIFQRLSTHLLQDALNLDFHLLVSKLKRRDCNTFACKKI